MQAGQHARLLHCIIASKQKTEWTEVHGQSLDKAIIFVFARYNIACRQGNMLACFTASLQATLKQNEPRSASLVTCSMHSLKGHDGMTNGIGAEVLHGVLGWGAGWWCMVCWPLIHCHRSVVQFDWNKDCDCTTEDYSCKSINCREFVQWLILFTCSLAWCMLSAAPHLASIRSSGTACTGHSFVWEIFHKYKSK